MRAPARQRSGDVERLARRLGISQPRRAVQRRRGQARWPGITQPLRAVPLQRGAAMLTPAQGNSERCPACACSRGLVARVLPNDSRPLPLAVPAAGVHCTGPLGQARPWRASVPGATVDVAVYKTKKNCMYHTYSFLRATNSCTFFFLFFSDLDLASSADNVLKYTQW
jgi:hypothetical protein